MMSSRWELNALSIFASCALVITLAARTLSSRDLIDAVIAAFRPDTDLPRYEAICASD